MKKFFWMMTALWTLGAAPLSAAEMPELSAEVKACLAEAEKWSNVTRQMIEVMNGVKDRESAEAAVKSLETIEANVPLRGDVLPEGLSAQQRQEFDAWVVTSAIRETIGMMEAFLHLAEQDWYGCDALRCKMEKMLPELFPNGEAASLTFCRQALQMMRHAALVSEMVDALNSVCDRESADKAAAVIQHIKDDLLPASQAAQQALPKMNEEEEALFYEIAVTTMRMVAQTLAERLEHLDLLGFYDSEALSQVFPAKKAEPAPASEAYEIHLAYMQKTMDSLAELVAALETVTDLASADAAAEQLTELIDVRIPALKEEEKTLPKLSSEESARLSEAMIENISQNVEGPIMLLQGLMEKDFFGSEKLRKTLEPIMGEAPQK